MCDNSSTFSILDCGTDGVYALVVVFSLCQGHSLYDNLISSRLLALEPRQSLLLST